MKKYFWFIVLSVLLTASFALIGAAENPDTDPAMPVGDEYYSAPEMDDINWTTGGDMPTPRYSGATGWYDGRMFVTHGRFSGSTPYNTAACEAYNPTTNTWSTMTAAPTARRMVGFGMPQIGNVIYVAGGRTDASTTVGTLEAYDMSTDTWTTLAPCTGRWAHGAATAGGYLYVFGSSGSPALNTSVERYNPATNTWSAMANLPAGRGWCAGASLNGLVYCVAGSAANTLYEYNPATNAWTTKAPLPSNLSYHTAVGDPVSNKIYVFGGNTTAITNQVLVWDAATNTWSTETNMPGARNWVQAGIDPTGNCYVFGGFDGVSVYYDDTWVGTTGAPPVYNIVVDLTYVSGSPVPASGGNLTFNVWLQNQDTQAAAFDAWLASGLVGQTPTTLVLRSFTGYQPGWTINRPGMFYPVPGGWPSGSYNFYLRVGGAPSTIWDEDSFGWSKSADDGNVIGGQPWAVDGAPNPFDKIEMSNAIAADYNLISNHPNPFNPSTTISYTINNTDHVTLSVFDVTGREVARLVDGYRTAGTHQVNFDASGLASGVYLYRLEANGNVTSAKMILMK